MHLGEYLKSFTSLWDNNVQLITEIPKWLLQVLISCLLTRHAQPKFRCTGPVEFGAGHIVPVTGVKLGIAAVGVYNVVAPEVFPPATLAEITFDAGPKNIQDFYDVSLVDGYNLQMTMTPRCGYTAGSGHYYCSKAGCSSDLNQRCPMELVVNGTGGVVACKSACLAFNRDEYCCRGANNVPQTCPPFRYSRIFKAACPEAYSYAYDDKASTFTCNNNSPGTTSYNIVFCTWILKCYGFWYLLIIDTK